MSNEDQAQEVQQSAASGPAQPSRQGLELAVVLSVIYLAMQISSKNKLLRSQSYFNFLNLAHTPMQMLIDNKEFSGVVLTCDQTLDTVSPVNLQRCMNYYFIMTNTWEYAYYQNRAGTIPPQLWAGADEYYINFIITTSGFRQFWITYNVAFSEPFHAHAQAAFDAITSLPSALAPKNDQQASP